MIYFMKESGLPGKGEKLAGMAVTSEHPSEVNKKIMNFFFHKEIMWFPISEGLQSPLHPSPVVHKRLECLVLSKWVFGVLEGIWLQWARLDTFPLGARMRSYWIRKFELHIQSSQ